MSPENDKNRASMKENAGDFEMIFVFFLFLVILYLVEVNIIIHFGSKDGTLTHKQYF